MRGLRLGFGVGVGGGIVSAYPSLIMDFVPTAGIEVERSSRTFDQLIDFTRTSSATYVDATGKIVSTPASRNLLTFTQEFDNAAWGKTNATITANAATAPDGTLTADKLIEDATNAAHVMQQSATLTAAAHTFSVYLKAKERTWAQVLNGTIANGFAYFNLSTGAVGTVGAGVTATSVTSVGNGWYRCSITFTASSGGSIMAVRTASANGTGSYLGDGTSGIFIWGAQLEQASTATDYTRNFGGVYPPRFDYDPVTLAPKGLLVEEQRTNLLLRSEEFDNASWAKGTGGSISANSVVSPDGTVDADAYTWATSSANYAFLSQSASATSTNPHTFSIWLKRPSGSGSRTVRLVVSDVTTSTATSSTFTVTDAWQRFEFTRTSANSTGLVGVGLAVGSSGTPIAAGEVLEVWGAQLEAGAFATSYIPTVASQVTRTADVATITGANFSQWYNQSSGTFVAEFQTVALRAGGTTGHRVIAAYDGTASNVSYLYTYAAIAGGQIVAGGVLQADLNGGGSPANNTTIKSAMAYATNDVAAAVNGATPTSDTSATMPTVNRLALGSQQGASQLNGWLRSVRYYPTRLTNAQLQALTA